MVLLLMLMAEQVAIRLDGLVEGGQVGEVVQCVERRRRY
jgi:hypothetical protein